MRYAAYMMYGVMMLGGATYAEYRGWTFQRVSQVKDVPKTVRDNPGAYRSHYAYAPRYMGGK